ncbi:MAG: nitroreductase family protein [Armatimonadota bacterium]
MSVLDIIKKRRSVRAYLPDEVSEDKLHNILEAARLAPSARNKQNWKFIVIKDKETKAQVARISGEQMFIADAPVVIAAVSVDPEYNMRCGIPAHAVDLGIAMEHIALAAAEEGLGSCWIGAFNQDDIKKVLNVPEKYKVVAVMPIGYANDKEVPKSRKELKDIVCYNKFEE